MTNSRKLALALACTMGIANAAGATDYTVLREDKHVHDRLLGASIAWLIEESCPKVTRRALYALTQTLKLRSYALDLGYTDEELGAYVDSKEEQDRFRAIALPYLASLGVVEGDAESYCAAGRAEIEKGTVAGSLMRMR